MAQALEVTIWDVQHGSAAFISTPTGKKLAIDLGVGSFKNPSDATFSPLKHLRNKGGHTSLDALIITHPHTDHIDDIVNLHLLKPVMILAPKGIDRVLVRKGNKSKDKTVIDTYFEWIDSYNQPVTPGKEMSNPTEWGCSIQWFFPVYDGPNLNNYSIVTVLSYAGSTIVIPGDNEAPSWKSLLEQTAFVNVIKNTNVFVASHHGRESGYHADVFKHFKPKLCVVSDTNDIPTSVTDKYTYQAEGMTVFNRETKTDEIRKTVTTRSDDSIYIKCWSEWDTSEGRYKNWISGRIN
jgi:beta-lactamase superfamily II metal-dependent hydrolase